MCDALLLSGSYMYSMAVIEVLHKIQLSSIEKCDINNFKCYNGVSAGAIICLCLVIGANLNQFNTFLCSHTNTNFIGNVGDIANGKFIDIDYITYIVDYILKMKNINKDISLVDLYKITEKEFNILVSCKNKIECINYKTYPNMKVVDAIKYACYLEIVFHTKHKFEYDFKDCGYIHNFPIHFVRNLCPKYKILGLSLRFNRKNITTIDSLVYHITHLKQKEVININLDNVICYNILVTYQGYIKDTLNGIFNKNYRNTICNEGKQCARYIIEDLKQKLHSLS